MMIQNITDTFHAINKIISRHYRHQAAAEFMHHWGNSCRHTRIQIFPFLWAKSFSFHKFYKVSERMSLGLSLSSMRRWRRTKKKHLSALLKHWRAYLCLRAWDCRIMNSWILQRDDYSLPAWFFLLVAGWLIYLFISWGVYI